MLSKEERVLRVIQGKDVDYLPSQITFSDRTRDIQLSEALGLPGAEALDGYLENHLAITLSLNDKTLFYRNDRAEMKRLQDMGFCGADWENKRVYDSWGMGIQVDSDGFFANFHPLQGKTAERDVQFMPPDVNRDALSSSIEEAVSLYTAPDIHREGNFDEMERDLAEQSGDFLVIPSGYFGIYERAYGLMGFQEFMSSLVLKPKVAHQLLDKITDYKVEVARKIVDMGFKVAHHGDDLGTQDTTLFSQSMFREFILPRIKRYWDVFNDAGIPIMMHSCGCLTDFLPDLIDIGLRVLEPVQPCMDLAFLKKEYGKDLVFWGGIETQNYLPFGTPEQVKEKARETIRTLGKGGGLIIGPSQEVMNDVPLENVKALVETIIEERQTVLDI